MIGYKGTQEQDSAQEHKCTRAQVKVLFVFLQLVTCALVTCAPLCFPVESFAQDNDKLVTLSKQIIEAKTADESASFFEELKALYFADHKYSEFVEFLKSLAAKKKNIEPFTDYYIALSRYSQLKYLEEAQSWDEYFEKGNSYRQELEESANRVIGSLPCGDGIRLYARLLLWRFHKDQQDAFRDESLAALSADVLEYAKTGSDAKPIKEIADQLLSSDEKSRAKELYRLYVNKLVTSETKQEDLLVIAANFHQEKNLELSGIVYDAYIEKILSVYPKEKVLSALIDIAGDFTYNDKTENDPAYAEKIFAKIEEVGSKNAFDEGLLYLRGFNLEKAKDYPRAKDVYTELISRYPQAQSAQKVSFKLGIIHAYISGDIKTGKGYFDSAAQNELPTPWKISSLYQLGLLSQWEGDNEKAKGYYAKLMENANGSTASFDKLRTSPEQSQGMLTTGEDFQESVDLAKERIKEIEEQKPIEYNLRSFLEACFGLENASLDGSKLDLRIRPCLPNINQEVKISSTAYLPESGCMQVELYYLWSGHLGTARPTQLEGSFSTQYLSKGTKEVNLVVISPSGVVDRNIDMADVE